MKQFFSKNNFPRLPPDFLSFRTIFIFSIPTCNLLFWNLLHQLLRRRLKFSYRIASSKIATTSHRSHGCFLASLLRLRFFFQFRTHSALLRSSAGLSAWSGRHVGGRLRHCVSTFLKFSLFEKKKVILKIDKNIDWKKITRNFTPFEKH